MSGILIGIGVLIIVGSIMSMIYFGMPFAIVGIVNLFKRKK